MVLPGCELCTTPRPAPRPVPGELRIGWLKAFTKSDRNVSRYFSVKTKLFSARHVEIDQTGPAHCPYAASAEGLGLRWCVCARVEPLVSASRILLLSEDMGRSYTIGARSAGVGPRSVTARDGQRKASVP